MKEKLAARSGASIAAALILFLICFSAVIIISANSNAYARQIAAIRKFESSYRSASSAARLIRDSVTDADKFNVLTGACLQAADNENENLDVTIKANGLPSAVCKIIFDGELNLTATVRAESLILKLTIPTTVPGAPVWDKENALIERVKTSEAENAP